MMWGQVREMAERALGHRWDVVGLGFVDMGTVFVGKEATGRIWERIGRDGGHISFLDEGMGDWSVVWMIVWGGCGVGMEGQMAGGCEEADSRALCAACVGDCGVWGR